MVIGRRWNVVWENLTSVYLPEHVTAIARQYGRLHTPSAVDYFIIARNEFPWEQLPDVVIARRGYDNYLVMLAIRENVSVVDITNTLIAVHQTDSEAQAFGRHHTLKEYNMNVLGKFFWRYGWTSSSQFMTKTVLDRSRNADSIIIVRREATKPKTRARRNDTALRFIRKYPKYRSYH